MPSTIIAAGTVITAGQVGEAINRITAGTVLPSGIFIPAFDGTDPQFSLTEGQSLSQGQVGGVGLTLANPFGAPIPVESANNLALVEAALERPVSAAVFQLRTADNTRVYIGGSNGLSGQTIQMLRDPSVHWTNFENGLDTVDSNQPAASLYAIAWIQGNSNQSENEGVYLAQLDLYQAEVQTEADARLTGQGPRVVVMWMMQTSNATNALTDRDFSFVPYDMWDAYKANPDKFRVVGPQYKFTIGALEDPFDIGGSTDGVHMVNTGYRHMAELIGEAHKQTYVDGNVWEPLEILSARVENTNEVLLTFNEDITIDTTNVESAPSYGGALSGLYMVDSGPQPQVIQSIAAESTNQIRCTCSGQPHIGAQIWTGRSSRRTSGAGPGLRTDDWGSMRTNIRKSTAEAAGNRSGDDLYKWCAFQRIEVTGGAAAPASNGTVTLDRRWTAAWAAQDANPGTGNWSPLVGSVSLPLLAGTATANQSTTGLNDNALGSTLVDEGIDNTGSLEFRITDAGQLANTTDILAGERFLFRFIGNLRRPSVDGYLFHKGGFVSDLLAIRGSASGNVLVQFDTPNSPAIRSTFYVGGLPATDTLGILDVLIDHDFQQRTRVSIFVSGVEGPGSGIFGETIGALQGQRSTFFAADNSSANYVTDLTCFIGIATGEDAGWFNPEAAALDNSLVIAP